MGGAGIRFGGTTPKQFRLLQDKPLYRYALETFFETGVFDEIVLVCHKDWMDQVEPPKNVRLIAGGMSRQDSSKAGLLGFYHPPEIVAIHDAVRPFVAKETILANIEAAIAHGAADTCIPTADTLVFAPEKETIHSIPKREDFLRGQTPQTFRYELIWEAHRLATLTGLQNVSDDCRLVLEQGKQVAVVLGTEENFKITSEFDLQMAEALLGQKSRNSLLK
jgi:2-C-methyl-D-erythritol 4-phosphate cytidylyltransferase